jgi:hypothetical protein
VHRFVGKVESELLRENGLFQGHGVVFRNKMEFVKDGICSFQGQGLFTSGKFELGRGKIAVFSGSSENSTGSR